MPIPRAGRAGKQGKEGLKRKEGSLGAPGCSDTVAVGMKVVGTEGGEQQQARAHAKQPHGAVGEGSVRLETVPLSKSLPPMGGMYCEGQWWPGMWYTLFCGCMCAWRRKEGKEYEKSEDEYANAT
eukprot:evm.model.NODE_51573_length_27797_cov_44.275784.2